MTTSTNNPSTGVEPLAVSNDGDNFSPARPAMSSDEHGLSVLYAAAVRVKATDEADAVEGSNVANEPDKPRHRPLTRSVAPHGSAAGNGDGGNARHDESLFISEEPDLERELLLNTESAQGKVMNGELEVEEIGRDVWEREAFGASVSEQQEIETEDEMSQTVQVLRESERQPVAKRLRLLHQESQFIRTPNGKKLRPFSNGGRM